MNQIDKIAASEYLSQIRERYRKANGRKEKTRLLNEYCFHTGRSRKHVIRLLGSSDPYSRERKPREATYDGEVTEALVQVWELFGRPCGQRLKPLLDQEIDRLRFIGELKISDEVAQKLVQISSATIDRRLKAERAKLRGDQRETPVRELAPLWKTQRKPIGQESPAYEVPVAVPSQLLPSQIGDRWP